MFGIFRATASRMKNIYFRSFALLAFAPALMVGADKVSIGVKGGIPITDAFDTVKGTNSGYFATTKRYLIGPTIEFHLPARFSIEIDALYKRLGYQFDATGPFVSSRTVANTWEFPLLAKFEILPGPIRPFVDAGA